MLPRRSIIPQASFIAPSSQITVHIPPSTNNVINPENEKNSNVGGEKKKEFEQGNQKTSVSQSYTRSTSQDQLIPANASFADKQVKQAQFNIEKDPKNQNLVPDHQNQFLSTKPIAQPPPPPQSNPHPLIFPSMTPPLQPKLTTTTTITPPILPLTSPFSPMNNNNQTNYQSQNLQQQQPIPKPLTPLVLPIDSALNPSQMSPAFQLHAQPFTPLHTQAAMSSAESVESNRSHSNSFSFSQNNSTNNSLAGVSQNKKKQTVLHQPRRNGQISSAHQQRQVNTSRHQRDRMDLALNNGSESSLTKSNSGYFEQL
jgi:hypothetical protein